MRIRLLVGWNGAEKGAELDLDVGQASLLIERAKAVLVEAPAAKAEKPAENKAVSAPPKAKRK